MNDRISSPLNEKLEVLVFAGVRELVGAKKLSMRLEKPEPVDSVLNRIVAMYPKLESYRSSMRAAVNLEYVENDFVVFNGDELAIITPVSGG